MKEKYVKQFTYKALNWHQICLSTYFLKFKVGLWMTYKRREIHQSRTIVLQKFNCEHHKYKIN